MIHLQPESFQQEIAIKKWLAAFLKKGQLRLVVGAGVSSACGLPQWKELILAIEELVNIDESSKPLEDRAEDILHDKCGGNRIEFANLVRQSLYKDNDDLSFSLNALGQKDLLVAIGAITMAGLRYGAREVVTFNFDDMLEMYLTYYGFTVSSTANLPRMNIRDDLEVLHIHGLLPSNKNEVTPREVVFTASEFDEVVGDKQNLWHQKVCDILSSNICLFIGLSGNDSNLTNMLNYCNKIHAAKSDNKYWGVRFSDDDSDPKKNTFERYGVLQVTIPHSNLPEWLMHVTQLASIQHK